MMEISIKGLLNGKPFATFPLATITTEQIYNLSQKFPFLVYIRGLYGMMLLHFYPYQQIKMLFRGA